MSNSRFQELFELCIAGNASASEREEFLQLVELPENQDKNIELINEYLSREEGKLSLTQATTAEIVDSIVATEEISAAEISRSVHRVHFLRKWGWAAAVLLVLGTAAYLWNINSNKKQTLLSDNKPLQTDIAPGHDRAILTLANGQQVILDSTQGNVVENGSLRVINLAGKLKYEGLGKVEEYNTLSTPKGGQYQIVLPDGSKVWLNASSSITFPTAFAYNKRQVKIEGEVYFEVAKNTKKPFVVDVKGKSIIEVLGTSFNINSYEDEKSIKTTLFEGSVKVGKADHHVILKPGQQAQIAVNSVVGSSDQQLKIISNPDIDQALAWKNGLFNFNGADLHAVMRQLERWYDIKVQYKGSTSNAIFEGKMYRNVNLGDVLEVLQEMGVQFQLEGKTLIVL